MHLPTLSNYEKSTDTIDFAQSAGDVEYTDSKECPVYDTKHSDDEVPVMLEL